MTDYLSRIAAKNLNPSEAVQPRQWSLFEPPSEYGGEAIDPQVGSRNEEDGFVSEVVEPCDDHQIRPPSHLNIDLVVGTPTSGEARGGTVGPISGEGSGLQPSASETMLEQALQDSSISETIRVKSVSKMEMTTYEPPSHEVRKRDLPEEREPGYPEKMIRTSKAGPFHPGASDLQPPSKGPIPALSRPDPDEEVGDPAREKMGTISSRSGGEEERSDTGSFYQGESRDRPINRRHQGSYAANMRTEPVRISDSRGDGAGTTQYKNITDQTPPEPNRAENKPGPERSDTATGSREVSPQLRAMASSRVMVRTKAAGTIRREAADLRPFPDNASKAAPTGRGRKHPSRGEDGPDAEEKPGRRAVDISAPSPWRVPSRTPKVLGIGRRLPGSNDGEFLKSFAQNEADEEKAGGVARAGPARKDLPSTAQTRKKIIYSSEENQNPSISGIIRSSELGMDGLDISLFNLGRGYKRLVPEDDSMASTIARPFAPRSSESVKGTSPKSKETPTSVVVKIGRLEVRAAETRPPPPKPQRKAVPPAQKLSLDEYLKQRNRGRA